MNNEQNAWERLITMGILKSNSLYSPSRAKEQWYSTTLKTELKRQDKQAQQPQAAKNPQDRLRYKWSTAEALLALDQKADELLSPTSSVAQADRLIHLRELAREMGLIMRDSELQRRLWEARGRTHGSVEMILPGVTVAIPTTTWAWEGVLMREDSNLMASVPKVGKTTLIVAAVGAWHHGKPDYLGLPFCGPCPDVVIIGVDMPRSRWMPLLARFGLAEQVAEGHWQLHDDGPIKGLFTQSEPLHLDAEGLARISEVTAKFPRCLLIADSYAKLVGPLGLREGDASFAGPLGDLQEVIAPHGVTLVLIHHAGHARKGEGAVAACRGSTALPAAVSQVISLSWFQRNKDRSNRLVLLETEGRGGEPMQLLIEQHETGWSSHGDPGALLQEQALAAAEEKLTERQAEVLDLVRDRAAAGEGTNSRVVREMLKIPDRQALRVLRQLEKSGFLRESPQTSDIGSSVWFSPA